MPAVTRMHAKSHAGTLILCFTEVQTAAGNTITCRGMAPEWADQLVGAGFALCCWLCSASADVMMGHVYGALLVAVL